MFNSFSHTHADFLRLKARFDLLDKSSSSRPEGAECRAFVNPLHLQTLPLSPCPVVASSVLPIL